MARWKLLQSHYLHARPPEFMEDERIEWEYRETDTTTGRERRKRFSVPFYLDEGLIVCTEGTGQVGDYTLFDAPTHDMLPLDAEAKAISAKLPKPSNIDDFLPAQGSSASILGAFEAQLTRIMNQMPVAPTPVAESGVSKDQFEELQRQVAALMAANAELQAAKPATPGTLNRKL